MYRIKKTDEFKSDCCSITRIVGHERNDAFKAGEIIEVTEKELKKIDEKNKNWYEVENGD